MKVMCIDKFSELSLLGNESNDPEIGKIYNVIAECNVGYVLQEIPRDYKGNTIWFDKRCFAPLSDIDELELVNEKELVS